MFMKNVLVTMSGGTTQVINATLVGIIEEWNGSFKGKIYAGVPGIQGFLNDSIKELLPMSFDKLHELYCLPGSSYIGTTRIAPLSPVEICHFNNQLKKYDIGYFINIGGNGTLKQTMDIQGKVPLLCCASAAKTIDNDLGDKEFVESYFTPGFPSCAAFWKNKVEMLNRENEGAGSHDQVLIAQTYGRETGFIAGTARLADPEREMPLLILLPEDQRYPTDLILAIRNKIASHGRCIVVMSEGYKTSEFKERKDKSGQTMYGSSESTACQELVNWCMDGGIQARLYNPTIDQRQDVHYRLESDLRNAHRIGKFIVKAFFHDTKSFFATVHKVLGVHAIPFSFIDDYSRVMLPAWIDYGNYDVTDVYVKYLNDVMQYEGFSR
jgi:ATP-dependent phosphofructokinase / diphosphate-dependent phosphofructokinase